LQSIKKAIMLPSPSAPIFAPIARADSLKKPWNMNHPKLSCRRCLKLAYTWCKNQLMARDCRVWSPPNTLEILCWFSSPASSYIPRRKISSPRIFALFENITSSGIFSSSQSLCEWPRLKRKNRLESP
jgi:hypothetical protein